MDLVSAIEEQAQRRFEASNRSSVSHEEDDLHFSGMLSGQAKNLIAHRGEPQVSAQRDAMRASLANCSDAGQTDSDPQEPTEASAFAVDIRRDINVCFWAQCRESRRPIGTAMSSTRRNPPVRKNELAKWS
jgi:hypothetical protein